MTAATPRPKSSESASEIEAAAFAWAARTDRGELTPEDHSALEQWLSGDSRRVGAYARALAVNAGFDHAAALGEHFSPADFEAPPPARHHTNRRWLLLGGGAAIAASVVGIAGYGALSAPAAIVTDRGEVRRIALSEGSAITVNTDSQVEPRFDAARREVDLSRGEALFDVAHDSTRPFVVRAGDVRARALGTSFTVRRFDDGAVEVAVLEGIVEVTRDGAARERLTAGQRSHVASKGSIRTEHLPRIVLEQSVGWRRGLIDLNGMTLDQAAAEFARYSDRRIAIADPTIGAMKVTGVYSTSDPLGFANAAALSLGILAERTPNGVRLSRR